MKCPFCDSDRGYYMLERVHRALLFNFDGEPIGGTEDVADYLGRCDNEYKLAEKYETDAEIYEDIQDNQFSPHHQFSIQPADRLRHSLPSTALRNIRKTKTARAPGFGSIRR